MSDYHVLQQALDEKTISVVFHIGIPATGINQAGLSWRDAIVLDLGGSANIDSVLPNIDAGELADLKAGALIEVPDILRWSIVGLTPAQMKAEIEARYSVLSNGTPESILEQKQITLAWIGYENDVP